MNNPTGSTQHLSDATVTSLLKVGVSPPDLLADLDALAQLPAKELWADVLGRWNSLGLKWSDASAARLLGEQPYRVKWWRRQRDLPAGVQRRLAALAILLAVRVCGWMESADNQELRTVVRTLRAMPDEAGDDGIKEILAILGSCCGEEPRSPAI